MGGVKAETPETRAPELRVYFDTAPHDHYPVRKARGFDLRAENKQ